MARKEYEIRRREKMPDGSIYHVNAHTEKEAQEKILARKKEIKAHIDKYGTRILVNTWATECMDRRCKNVTDGQEKNIRYRYAKHIGPAIGTMKLRDVTIDDCTDILQDMVDQGYAQGTVAKVRQDISYIFRMAKIYRKIEYNPAEDLALVSPKGKKAKARRPLTEQEKQWLIEVAEKDSRFVFYLVMLYTGCRNAEAAELKQSDILEVDGVRLLHIRGTKTENADRYVPLPDYVYDKLPKRGDDEYIFQTMQLKGKSLPHKLNKSDIDNLWKSCKRQLNIAAWCKVYRNHLVDPLPVAEDLTPYCLRHTYATELMIQHYSFDERTYLLGHSSIETTEDVYTHMDFSQAVNAAKNHNTKEWK